MKSAWCQEFVRFALYNNGMADKYLEKRDFSQTPEPSGKSLVQGDGPLTFVVQKHAARRLHYDLRLELDGVLKSWAVPNGPSTDLKVKRLATMVEDHPMDYASFEGVIPAGNYGAGQVIVWDHGTYSPDDGDTAVFSDREKEQSALREGLGKGKLSITFRGHKLKGSWALVKMQKTKNDWLLIKHGDFAAGGTDILMQEQSVISDLTIADLKEGKLPTKATTETLLTKLPGARRSSFPPTVSPMLAEQAKSAFSDPDWVFEPKLDGYRTIALVQNGVIRLLSRNGLDVTRQYPFVIEGLAQQPVAELVLDGEIVALDEKGRACFQCLQNYAQAMDESLPQKPNPLSFITCSIFCFSMVLTCGTLVCNNVSNYSIVYWFVLSESGL
jgi:bifunctional non-homologous end joining protein LigD